MDKSWMSKVRISEEYKYGVRQFLSFAFRDVRDGGEIPCPCVNCGNRKTQNYDGVETHLRCHGILQGYTIWFCHGEETHSASSSVFAHTSTATTSRPSTNVPIITPRQDGNRRYDDMQGLLDAVFVTPDGYDSLSSTSEGESNHTKHGIYNTGSPPEYENIHDTGSPQGFENTHDTGSPPEYENNAEHDNEGVNEDLYSSFLKDADTKLYIGCETFSKLSFLVTLYHMKCLHRLTQESFTALLGVFSDALPPDAKLPKNYHEAKKIIRGLGLNYKKIHACPKDCMLYWGEGANQQSCHVCGCSRWVDESNAESMETGHKKKPAKILRYFPLIPRLQRLFATEKTSTDMRWHDEGRTKDGLLHHPADGKAWKDFNARYPDFDKDSRNTRLGLASDGFNPFRNMSSKHSTWPVMLIPYNLPPWICMKHTSLMLSMIIPGPDSPGNDVDVYLQPLIDELKQLWKGVKTVDASTNKRFSLRAALLWTLNDFPALAYLYGWSTRGTYACPTCAGSTKSLSLKNPKKMSYMGHRRWLPKGHPYRRGKKFFYEKEDDLAPKPLDGSSVLKMLEGRVFVYGKKEIPKETKQGNKRKTKSAAKERGGAKKRKRAPHKKQSNSKLSKEEKRPEDWLKKRSIFFELPYWEHNLLRHNLDVMHIEKNVCDNLICTLLNIASKSKDNLNARLDLVHMGIRPDLHPKSDDQGKQRMPDAPFTMSREQKEILCSIIQNMKTPDGYASNISRCVNMKDCTLSGMKSHDCHVLIEDILPVTLRSCYPSKDVMKIVIELSGFFKKLCSKVLSIAELDQLQESIVLTLCDMERIFLPSFFTIMVHLLVHLVDEVKLGGPVHYRWMYPMERFFVRLKEFVRNRAHPEGSIAEGYIAEECLTFGSRFLDGITRFTRPTRNPNPSDQTKELYMFQTAGEPIGKIVNVNQFDNALLIQAHRYILRHCDELEELRSEFLDEERTRQGLPEDLTPQNIEQLINGHFADWLEQKVLLDDGGNFSEKIRALARKPNKYGKRFRGFIINGIRFHTIRREKRRKTQNSGVVNIAEDGVNYYGRLSDIIELSYGNDYKVVLFKCDWYDVFHHAGMKEDEFGFTLVNFSRVIHTGEELNDDPFVFSSQVEQVFYMEDRKNEGWHVVVRVRPRDLFDMGVEAHSDDVS